MAVDPKAEIQAALRKAIEKEAPGAHAAEWVSDANPAERVRSRPDKEVLIGSRG